jgi:Ran GTPase-activating protein (RanGAP) involved in mRNA processing and transport
MSADRETPVDSSRMYFLEQLDRISQDDPKRICLGIHGEGLRLDSDDAIAIETALQKSTHVRVLVLDVTCIASSEVCSTMERFLATSRSLSFISLSGPQPEERQLIPQVTDRILSAARKNPNVKTLCMDKIIVGAHALSNFLKSTSINDLALNEIGQFMPLLSSSELSSVASALKQCQSLRVMSLTDQPDEFMMSLIKDGLSNHPTLQVLTLNSWKVQGFIPIAKALGKCLHSDPPHFTTLRFFKSQFSFETMQPIIHGLLHNPTIQTLTFFCCEFDTESEGGTSSAISAFRSLLESSSATITKLNLYESIKSSEQLDAILTSIYDNSSIQYLNLSGCGLQTAISLNHLRSILHHNTNLEHLNISGNAINWSGTVGLLATGIHNLEALECASCTLSDVAMQALFPPVSFEDELEVGKESSLLPADSARSFQQSKLQELNLGENYFTSQGIETLVPYLQHPKFQIKSLRLAGNCIGNDGAIALANVLWDVDYPTSLVELNLSHCNIGVAGIASIFEAFSYAPSLKALYLDYINHEGLSREEPIHDALAVLAESLPYCQLEKLHLSGTIFDVHESKKQECQDSMLRGLAANETLIDVQFYNSIVDSQHQEHILYYTLRNKVDYHFLYAKDQDSGISDTDENYGDENDECRDTIPRGFWAHILAAVAGKQCSKASVLFHILSSRPDLMARRIDSSDVSPIAAIQSRASCRVGASKRDQAHIARSSTDVDSHSRKKR